MRRRHITGCLAAGTLAFIIGCGTKQADAPPAPSPSSVAEDREPQVEEKQTLVVEDKAPAPQRDARIEAVWESKLRNQPDSPPSNCAIAGHVRFFRAGKESSEEADGVVTIQLHDRTVTPQGEEPPPLEEWRIEGGTLKYFLASQVSSPEYTFVLPWSSYKPEITQVRMEVKYESKSGNTVSAKSDVLTLDRSELKEAVSK